jgi:hypothetical protein
MREVGAPNSYSKRSQMGSIEPQQFEKQLNERTNHDPFDQQYL